MSCEVAHSTLHGYFDGELDAARTVEFQQHLERCPQCQASLQRLEALRGKLRGSGLYEPASPELVAGIRASLAKAQPAGGVSRFVTHRWFRFPALAAAAVAAIAIAVLVVQPRLETARMNASMLVAHARSLQSGHLTDVASSDAQTISPWFSGKIDFAPPVADFGAQGFRLVGARLDVINGRNAAVLVYAHDTHVINLFVWRYDDDDKGFTSSGSARGYNWIVWQPANLRFCAISDLSSAELDRLKSLISQTS